MGFQIKTFKQILSSMVDWSVSNSSKLTNFYVGSTIRTLLEAVAIELESMYFQMYKGFKYSVANSIYNSFGFQQTPATPASGKVTFTLKYAAVQQFTITQGTQLQTVPIDGEAIVFEVTEDTVVVPGTTTIDVPVQCTQAGTMGNVPANTINLLVVRIMTVSSVTNNAAFLNGAPAETEADRKKRFAQYISTLPRGTISAIQYGCLKVPGVTGAYVQDGVGIVSVYVHDAQGNLSDALKSSVNVSLLDYRSAGIEVDVLPVTKKSVDVSITLLLSTGFDPATYQTMVVDSVTAWMNNFSVSKPLLVSALLNYIMSLDASAIENVTLNLTQDVTVQGFELIRAGTITATATVDEGTSMNMNMDMSDYKWDTY